MGTCEGSKNGLGILLQQKTKFVVPTTTQLLKMQSKVVNPVVPSLPRDSHDHESTVVGFTTTYAISTYHH
jgi:hypothetical protein